MNCIDNEFCGDVWQHSAWSDEGCRVLSTNRTHTQCRCDHLTNFAILMDLHSTRLSAANGVALAAITYVGCSVSIICLLLAIVTFTFFRGLQVHSFRILVLN